MQFSPLGNMNNFYREVDWCPSHLNMARIIDHPILVEIGRKYNKSSVHIALSWGLNNGRTVIPKSVIDWQIVENLEADSALDEEDMEKIGSMDIKYS